MEITRFELGMHYFKAWVEDKFCQVKDDRLASFTTEAEAHLQGWWKSSPEQGDTHYVREYVVTSVDEQSEDNFGSSKSVESLAKENQ